MARQIVFQSLNILPFESNPGTVAPKMAEKVYSPHGKCGQRAPHELA